MHGTVEKYQEKPLVGVFAITLVKGPVRPPSSVSMSSLLSSHSTASPSTSCYTPMIITSMSFQILFGTVPQVTNNFFNEPLARKTSIASLEASTSIPVSHFNVTTHQSHFAPTRRQLQFKPIFSSLPYFQVPLLPFLPINLATSLGRKRLDVSVTGYIQMIFACLLYLHVTGSFAYYQISVNPKRLHHCQEVQIEFDEHGIKRLPGTDLRRISEHYY